MLKLTACHLPTPANAPDISTRTLIPPTTLSVLLDRAEAALKRGHLLTPTGDSAYDHYQAVLKLNPDQPEALLGLEQIVNQFIHRAQEAIRARKWATARSMIDRARIVDRDYPSLPAIYTQLHQLQNAKRYQLDLTRLEVRKRHESAAKELARFGIHARNRLARVIIRAGSDSDGRWIYEQLNKAPGNRRIRGEIRIGQPPRVIVVVLAIPEA